MDVYTQMLSKTVSWHEDHPYEATVKAIVPQSRWVSQIETALLHIWVASHSDYKTYKSKDLSTFYDMDIEILTERMTSMKADCKKEDEVYQSLLTTLEEHQRSKSPGPVEPLKTALAVSQQKLVSLHTALDALEDKLAAYKRYQEADQYYIKALNGIVLHYVSTQDERCLVEDLNGLYDAYHKKLRVHWNSSPCKGTKQCETHYLPLSYVASKHVCRLSP